MRFDRSILADYVAELAVELTAGGIRFSPPDPRDPISFLAAYCQGRTRMLTPRPRRVELSQEVTSLLASSIHGPAIASLHALTTCGADLSPYLSKQIKSLTKADLLLIDWNIHHLHLGSVIPGDRFAARTGDLLFATFLDDVAYFIGVSDHTSFSEIDLLEVLDANWPAYLDRFKFASGGALSLQPISADVAALRKTGVQSVVTLASGHALFPPGGGYTVSGASLRCVRAAQAKVRDLERAEAWAHSHDADIRRVLGLSVSGPIRLEDLRKLLAHNQIDALNPLRDEWLK